MDPSASFSSLPPELVSKICHDPVLKKQDLIALRFTSKSQGIHLSASKKFANRYFTDIPLVYTRYSLEAFVGICKHPVFSRAVKKVQLSCARFRPDCFEQESESMLNLSCCRYYETRSQARHEYLDDIRLLVNRCDEEECLKISGEAKDLLTTAFTALPHGNHSLKLCVSSSEYGALGGQRLYSPDNLGENEHWGCDILGTVSLLCHAASPSKCVVQRLKIEGVFNLVDSSPHSLSALARLPGLKVDIWPPDDISQVAGLDGTMTKIVENAIDLKILDITSYPADSEYNFLHKVFSTMSTMKLEKLTLRLVNLKRFKPFDKRMESLRRLRLYDCDTGDSFTNIFRSIQDNCPGLEYFWLGIDRIWASQGFVEFEGVEGVYDGIDKLIQSEAMTVP